MDLTDFLDDGKNEEYYENINRTNVMNMSLIITEGKYGAIDTEDYSCHGYHTIRFSLLTYTLQAYLSIDRQVI